MKPTGRWHFAVAGLLMLAVVCSGTLYAGNTRAANNKSMHSPRFTRLASQQDLEDQVLDLFENSCAFAGCHAGMTAPKNLDLSEEVFVANLVGVKSAEAPQFLRVKPGDAQNSYLVKKIRGAADIKGDRMPRSGKPLSAAEMATIEAWINSLPADMQPEPPRREFAQAFYGWTLANIPTAEMLDRGTFLFRIGHRFLGKLNDGYDGLFGIDPGAAILLQLSFPITDNLLIDAFRARQFGDVELAVKYRFLREKTDGSMPFSLALRAGGNWESSNKTGGRSRTDAENFHYFGQLVLTKAFGNRLSLAAVPAVLLEGNSNPAVDEDPLVTIGLGGRLRLYDEVSFFGEWVPILSGFSGTFSLTGQPNRYDTWAAGVERKIGGHVFQVFLTNSQGLTTDQYMNGGELDIDDSWHLAFNIYRVLAF